MFIDKKIILMLHKFVSKKKRLKKALDLINLVSVIIFITLYSLCALMLLISLDRRLIKFLLIPALVLLVVTILRKAINRKRPFEALEIEPAMEHDAGCSFPSRHASSAMIIALSVYWNNPIAGGVLIFFALLTAVTRVLAGVHYPIDVLAGIIISILFSILFYI
ncbi:phosphatase PAP2 family protein [Acetivibrio saccincola]|mgnify:CR=1 FL=1|jgi:undecaprenyl-diphosphatase|uniref:Undecaprenyl-diphosphatase BcrC n=2 Tax=Acetivibrio saccincola TaxID=1677857 RepID=A0A2K9E070_9FIRM|nr:phosphatase PAP2 family protein [Acetivibrio saccincola]AUG57172.1 Undecaprenyl-diphosphatase BcrC [Acetivibrio saccincola]HOA96798.1 phosphatase PAP2 family protein [Acetivibrio saccincola]HQD29872.1 phosphatase PAP2 family protein [Acetivibrio saccincola]